ncbi:MAG: VanZ family protein [Acidimicrobiia bacterium]|nr:VanZ family protein [Acidimicrobiia bacterium]
MPLATISQQLADAQESGIRQLIGNLFLLAPLGFLLPVVGARFHRLATLLGAFAVSLGIELTQIGISVAVGFPYRAFDVDDLLLNTIGAAIGWAGWRIMFA